MTMVRFFKFLWALLRWSPAIIFAVWLAGLMAYAHDIPDRVVDPDTQTDAIVVLTGGSERLAEGLALLRRHMGRKLFISGVHHGVEVPDLLRLAGQKPEGLECCIALGYTADNTWAMPLKRRPGCRLKASSPCCW